MFFWLSGCAAAAGPGKPASPATPQDAAAPAPVPTPAPGNGAAAPGADAAAPSPTPPADAGPSDPGGPPRTTSTVPRREAFLALLRKLVDPLPPIDARLMPPAMSGGLIQQDFSFASTPSWRVPGTLRRPASATGRLPVVICLHETGSDRNSGNVVGITTALASRGFLTVAISGRYFGAGGGNPAYVNALKAAYAKPGSDYPFLYDTAWDTMRLIDYLVTRDDVDPQRIGLTGVSKGGMETYLVAAADPRVAAAAPIIGIQSFKWGLEHDAFQARANSLGGAVPNSGDAASVRQFYDRVAPGLVDQYDCPDMLPLIAPRPLVVISGTQDPRNAFPGVQLAVDAAKVAYAAAGAPDKIVLFSANVGHDGGYAPFHDRAVAWFQQWLGSPKP
jgi:dienelactone hydrolase